MKTFLRANIASLSASFCDYLFTILLVECFYANSWKSSIAGTMLGGMVNFIIGRYWVFKAHSKAFSLQGKKYLLVWFGNLILNAFGQYVLIYLLKAEYMIAKVVTSLLIAAAYNYPLQKRYVFKISD